MKLIALLLGVLVLLISVWVFGSGEGSAGYVSNPELRSVGSSSREALIATQGVERVESHPVPKEEQGVSHVLPAQIPGLDPPEPPHTEEAVTAETYESSLRHMLVHQQLAIIGKPFDGTFYKINRLRVVEVDTDSVIADRMLNPSAKSLSDAERNDLVSLLKKNSSKLRDGDIRIKKAENEFARDHLQRGLKPNGDGPAGLAPAFMQTLTDISGPFGQGRFAFSFETSPLRDSILWEQSRLIGDLELELIAWFQAHGK